MFPSLTQMTTVTAVNNVELSRPVAVEIEFDFKDRIQVWKYCQKHGIQVK
jgi:hypothetical protein